MAEALEEYIVEILFEEVGGSGFMERLREHSSHDGDALDEVRRIEAERNELAELVGRGSMTPKQFEIANRAMEDRLSRAMADFSHDGTKVAIGRYAGSAQGLREAWPAMTLDQRRAVLSSVIESITILPGRPRGANRHNGPLPVDPERVAVTWRV